MNTSVNEVQRYSSVFSLGSTETVLDLCVSTTDPKLSLLNSVVPLDSINFTLIIPSSSQSETKVCYPSVGFIYFFTSLRVVVASSFNFCKQVSLLDQVLCSPSPVIFKRVLFIMAAAPNVQAQLLLRRNAAPADVGFVPANRRWRPLDDLPSIGARYTFESL
jgi:hypothetical protein